MSEQAKETLTLRIGRAGINQCVGLLLAAWLTSLGYSIKDLIVGAILSFALGVLCWIVGASD